MSLSTIVAYGMMISGVGLTIGGIIVYFLPPKVTPMSDEGLANINRIQGYRGDDNNAA